MPGKKASKAWSSTITNSGTIAFVFSEVSCAGCGAVRNQASRSRFRRCRIKGYRRRGVSFQKSVVGVRHGQPTKSMKVKAGSAMLVAALRRTSVCIGDVKDDLPKLLEAHIRLHTPKFYCDRHSCRASLGCGVGASRSSCMATAQPRAPSESLAGSHKLCQSFVRYHVRRRQVCCLPVLSSGVFLRVPWSLDFCSTREGATSRGRPPGYAVFRSQAQPESRPLGSRYPVIPRAMRTCSHIDVVGVRFQGGRKHEANSYLRP
ncbi:hypothetical protein BDW02DRAFT_69590 [Decorospora gaudefroyi]|uniref:Uncharacterized protein n=1 Tax=Decorospora gaudefroyi TaxID=184978 RepID=A0A6A5K2U5_9PLEO|nr:hypothetical protein BDW02DRAFT_69590 [Decorospora gaudefroyi]